MTGPTLRLAWYRFRAPFRRRWGGYLALALAVLAALVLANLVAALPARQAARTPAAEALRAE